MRTTYMYDDLRMRGGKITSLLEEKGSVGSLQQDCLTISAYNKNNYISVI
ncbi:hypothetical protein P4530_13280 [Bacillus thuringiensis]|nr:hypothetical protein [Bacillus thuringiensis]